MFFYSSIEFGGMIVVKRIIISFLIISIISLGCGKIELKSEERLQKTIANIKISEIDRSVLFAPQYIAISKGFFKLEGLNVELFTNHNNEGALASLFSDELTFALMGPENIVLSPLLKNPKEIKAIAQITQRSGAYIIARKEISDFQWKNIKNKVIIGAKPGSTPELILEHILRNNHLSPQTGVNIITNLEINNVMGAYQAGIGDFILIAEPHASILEEKQQGFKVRSLATDFGPISYSTYLATKEYIDQYPEIIQGFTNAIYQAQIWIYTHEAKEIVKAIKPFFPDTEKEIILKGVNEYLKENVWAPTPIVQQSGMNRLLDMLMEAKELNKKPSFETLVNNEFALRTVK